MRPKRHFHGRADPLMDIVGECEIRIENLGHDDLKVSGFFEDGSMFTPIKIFKNDAPHTISLIYSGQCSKHMMLYIDIFHGQRVFAGFVPKDHLIQVFASGKYNLEPLK